MFGPQVFFVLWLSHSIFGKWVYHHRTICHIHSWPLYDIDLLPQYQNYIFTVNLFMVKVFFAFWHMHIKFVTRVYHHDTTCCVHSWLCPFWFLSEFIVSLEKFSIMNLETITGEGLQILTYTRHSWPLSSEGSLTCHNFFKELGQSRLVIVPDLPHARRTLFHNPTAYKWK